MTTTTPTRRLAAILVADVAGYSRMMEADEAGILAALKERRETILEPVIREHGGRIVNFMGDGALVEFASAVNAVKAALAVQAKFAALNEVQPTERRIELRIGINLGDVVGEGDDIFGDGVNIAARLEALAEPGGVCISAKVHDEVRGKIEAGFSDIGEQQLKNIAAPVRAFSWSGSEAPVIRAPRVLDKPSIAVLPFSNMSGEPDQQYFSDGITEDIITELSRFRALSVIARNSSFQYRDKAVDVRRVARELAVRYVVEGSVRKMGSRIRITAQLIDAIPGTHLWSERFDRNIEDLFAVQDEVTQTIVATISGRLEDAEIKSATRRRTSSLPAYDCFLHGVELLRGYGVEDNRRAREFFEQAVSLDSRFALANAYLALSLLVENHYSGAPQAIKDRALAIALSAIRLDPRDSRCHQILSEVYSYRAEFEAATSHMELALKLNPNDANGMASHGGLLGMSGRAEEGVELIRRAMTLNPYHPEWYWSALAIALYSSRRYEECLEANGKIRGDKHHWQMARSAACLVQLGRLDEARALAAEILQLKPDFSLRAEMPPYKFEADAKHVYEAMCKAGLPE